MDTRTTRTSPRSIRYTVTAPGRMRLIEQAQNAGCADTAAMRLLHRPDTAEVDSLVEHLRVALRLAVRAHQQVRTSAEHDFDLARTLGSLEPSS